MFLIYSYIYIYIYIYIYVVICSDSGAKHDLNLGVEGSNQVQGYKDCPHYLIPASTMVGGEENL